MQLNKQILQILSTFITSPVIEFSSCRRRGRRIRCVRPQHGTMEEDSGIFPEPSIVLSCALLQRCEQFLLGDRHVLSS